MYHNNFTSTTAFEPKYSDIFHNNLDKDIQDVPSLRMTIGLIAGTVYDFHIIC